MKGKVEEIYTGRRLVYLNRVFLAFDEQVAAKRKKIMSESIFSQASTSTASTSAKKIKTAKYPKRPAFTLDSEVEKVSVLGVE